MYSFDGTGRWNRIMNYVNSILGLLHRVNVGNAADIFRVEVCKVDSFYTYIGCFKKGEGGRVEIGVLAGPLGRVGQPF
jgi:hypothetical protein